MQTVDASNPCAKLKDGSYPVRDVFKFLYCKKNKAKYIPCPSGTFYVPASKKCLKQKKNIGKSIEIIRTIRLRK